MTSSAMTATQAGEFRAAGTDLSERRRSGVSTGPVIDISAAADTIGYEPVCSITRRVRFVED